MKSTLDGQSTSSAAEGLTRSHKTNPTTLPSLHSGPPRPVWHCQSCFCQNADISKPCQGLGMKLRGHARLEHCDFVQMSLASAFWLSIIPLNYLFYKADYVFTFAGQLVFWFSSPSRIVRCSSGRFHFFFSASPFSASHFLCLFAGIWHCLEKN